MNSSFVANFAKCWKSFIKIKECHFYAEFNSACFEKKLALYNEFWWRKSRNTERDIYPEPPDTY